MKKLLASVLIALLFPIFAGVANAAPFLVCNPDPAATSYVVDIDGAETEVPAPLHMDLDGVSAGEHQIRAKARNIRGDSAYTPFLTYPAECGVPSGLRLSSD